MSAHDRPPLSVAVDVGGTKIAGGLVDAAGAVSAYRVVPTPRGALGDEDLAATSALVRELLDLPEARERSVLGIGVGLPEFVAPDGEVVSREVIGWGRQPREQLAEFGLPVAVESDVRAGGTAEALLGAGADAHVCAYVSVGTGISYCLVEGGSARAGAGGAAIALGELEVVDARTPAGETWLLEPYASGAGLAARYELVTGRHVPGAAELVATAERGDEIAALLLAEGGSALGAGISTLVHLLDPEVVVLGGGLGLSGGVYLDRCLAGLAARLRDRGRARRLPVRKAALGVHAGVIGAAVACFRANGLAPTARGRVDPGRTLTTITTAGRAPADAPGRAPADGPDRAW